MALIIETVLELNNGFSISNPYGRISATDNANGNSIDATMLVYLDKNAFESGKKYILPTGLPEYINIPYNRLVDGVDILNIAHDAFIAKLAEQGIIATKDL